MIVGRTVIQIDVPSMVAPPAVVADDSRFGSVPEYHLRMFFCEFIHHIPVGMPIAVASPGVEGPVVACLKYGIEHIVSFYQMSSPGTFTDVDAGTGQVVNTVVTDGDSCGHR